jgi:vacuolar-type H+-ATPase subunit I/STV1
MRVNNIGSLINVKNITNREKAVTNAVRQSNRATANAQASKLEQKPKAVQAQQSAQRASESTKRAQHNSKIQDIKQVTSQLNAITKDNGTKSNKLMVGVLLPPGAKISPQQLGNFIDRYA